MTFEGWGNHYTPESLLRMESGTRTRKQPAPKGDVRRHAECEKCDVMWNQALGNANRFAAFHVLGLALAVATFYFAEWQVQSSRSATVVHSRSHADTSRGQRIDMDLVRADSTAVLGSDLALRYGRLYGVPSRDLLTSDWHHRNPLLGAGSRIGAGTAPTVVPEPSTGLLLASGLAVLAARRRRMRRLPRREAASAAAPG